jgi:hypothetical protein
MDVLSGTMRLVKTCSVLVVACALQATGVVAQDVDTTATPVVAGAASSSPAPEKAPTKVYFGGTIGASFGDYLRISVTPMIGYKVSPKASIGLRVGYEYVSDSRGITTQSYHNYGASVFTRYFLIPQLYAHGEFAYYSYGFSTNTTTGEREWVPFLLLGAGVRQPMGDSVSFIVEILFDVINDDKSPYSKGSPFISVGIGVGL